MYTPRDISRLVIPRCIPSKDHEFGTTRATYQQASPPPDKSHSAFQTAPVPMDTVSFTIHCQPPQELWLHHVLPLPVSDIISSHPQMDLVKAHNGASMPRWLQVLWSHPHAEVGCVSITLGHVYTNTGSHTSESPREIPLKQLSC